VRVAAAICLAAGIAWGQPPQSNDPMAEVRAIQARPGTTWSDEDAKKVVGVTNNYILGLIYGAKVFQQQPPVARPQVIAEIANEAAAPYIREGKIHLPVEYFRLIEKLSYLLAHDLLLRETDIPVSQPLLHNPIGASALLPLMQPFKEQLTEEAFDAYVASVFQCAPANGRCDVMRRATYAAVLVFILGHELAHLFYEDAGSESTYATEVEIRADRKAWDLLGEVIKSGLPGNDREVQITMGAAALLPVSYQRQLLGSQPIASEFDKRVKALTALLPASVRGTVTRLVANREARDDTGTIRVSASEDPDLLMVNGVQMDNSEVLNRNLVVTGGMQRIFARKGSRFAFAGAYVSGGESESVQLVFENLKPTPLKPPEEGEYDPEHPGKEWFDVFLQTSDGKMEPRNPQLSMRHWEALSELRLNRFIPGTTEINLRPSEKDDLKQWHNDGVPLASWRGEK